MRIIQYEELSAMLADLTSDIPAQSVTGPGRSGSIAAVIVSHQRGLPYLPFGLPCPDRLRPLLVVDTATASGRTLRKAQRQYRVETVYAAFKEPPRVKFWYEKGAAQ